MRHVSVIIAAFNSAATIGRAVRSALAQPETAEILLVDDASTDGTDSVARAAADGSDRLTVVVLPKNQGPAAARNVALDRAGGTLIGILDADDWMEEGRIGRLLAAAGDGWDIAADDLLLADSGREDESRPRLGTTGPASEIGLAEFISANLPTPGAGREELGYMKPLIRRAFLEKHRLRYEPSLRLGEDYVLYASALALGARLRLVPACGYVARQSPGSLSRRHGAAELFELAKADLKLLALPGLAPDVVRLLKRHRRLTLDKHFHRVALDAKARHDWLAVARTFTGTRSAAVHILWETLAARIRGGASM